MSDDDKLHNFIWGMQGWAQNKIRRQNVKNMPGVIIEVDSLIHFQTTRPMIDVPSTSKPNKKGYKKGDGKRQNHKDNTKD